MFNAVATKKFTLNSAFTNQVPLSFTILTANPNPANVLNSSITALDLQVNEQKASINFLYNSS